MTRIPIETDSARGEDSESNAPNGSENSNSSGPEDNPGANGGQADSIACDDKGECEAPDVGKRPEPGQQTQPEPQPDPANLTNKEAEYLDMLRRMKAEFDNYKRRVARERTDIIQFATEGVITKILSISDDLLRGIDFARNKGLDSEILKGIELVERQLADLLSEYGAQPFDSLHQPFDPNIHEPLYTKETHEHDDNTIIEEERKGYKMHDKILRPARVVVSRKPAEPQAQE